MTAPVATEVWNNTHVTVVGGGTADQRNRELMFLLKGALIAGNGAWTVVSSSNSLVADNSDNWSAVADLAWNTAGNIHSWIVLQQAGMGDGSFQLCIDLNHAWINSERASLYVSYSDEFTGGSITNRPTATDEQSITTGLFWGGGPDVDSKGANILKTTSGKCTRVIFNEDGSVDGLWLIEEPKDARDFWDTPYFCYVDGNTSQPTYAAFQAASAVKVTVDGEQLECYLSCEGFNNKALPDHTLFSTLDYNSEWVCCPAGIVVNSTTKRGRLGEVRDWWWISPVLNTGDYMPGDASKAFVVINDLLQPWDGSNIIFD